MLVVTFFSLTRTEIGRDELRLEMMRQFNESYPGELHIGTLRGNLLNELYASDVELRDVQDRLLVHVDSVILRHSWSTLLGGDFTITSLRLLQPTFRFVYDSTQIWNAASALTKPDSLSKSSSSFQTIVSANFEIIDGTIETERIGLPPFSVSDSSLFDYTQTRISDLNAQTIVEWNPRNKLLDVFDLSFRVDSLDVRLKQSRGQVVVRQNDIALNGFLLETERSTIKATGALSYLTSTDSSSWRTAQIDLDLETADVNHAEIQRAFPRWPLSDQTVLSARIQGPFSQLVVDQLLVRRGQSKLDLSGTFIGFPDSLDVDLSFTDSQLDVRDVRAVLPHWSAVDKVQVTDLQMSSTTRGTLYLSDSLTLQQGHLQSDIQASSSFGSLAGNLAIDFAEGSLPTFETTLQFDSLGVGQMLATPTLDTDLHGTLTAQGAGLTLANLNGTGALTIHNSFWQDRPADSLLLSASYASNELSGTLIYVLQDSRLHADAYANFVSDRTVFGLELSTENLNAGPLLQQDSLETAFNTRWILAGSAQSWASLQGEWTSTTDSSWVQWADDRRLLPPHHIALNLASPHPDTTRLFIEGDVIQAKIESNTNPEVLVAWSTLWGKMGQEAVFRTLAKPYQPIARYLPSSLSSVPFIPQPGTKLGYQTHSNLVDRTLRKRSQTALDVRATLDVVRSDIISAYLPFLMPFATYLTGDIHARGDAHSLSMRLDVTGDSLITHPVSSHTFALASHITGKYQEDHGPKFSGDLVASSDTTIIRDVTLSSPRFVTTLNDTTATFRLDARQAVPTDTLLLQARLDLLPDRNRIRLEEMAVTASGTLWSLTEPAIADVYQDAVVTPGIVLSSQEDRMIYQQQLRVRGALSSFAADTLFVGSDNIVLRHLSDFAASRFPIGGLLTSELALVGSPTGPEVTGEVAIAQLSIRNRVLGDLSVSSSYIPGSSAIGLDVALQPTDSLARVPTIIGTSIPAEHEHNILNLTGSVRLPQSSERLPGGSDDFDLRLDITRADLFFFELIYPFALENVEGFLDGSGTIKGTFAYPVFEAAFETNNAAFQIPKFGLRYTAEGPVFVDSLAIRVPNLVVTDRTQGQAEVNGAFLFNSYDHFSFDLDGRLNDFLIMDMAVSDTLPFYGHIWASGDATLDGPVFGATLRSANATTSTNSDLYIPILEEEEERDQAFIIFADSTGKVPDFRALTRRRNVVAPRPVGERSFAESVNMDLNVVAPPGSSINLVFDELLGDVLRGVGSGRVQFLRDGGAFSAFGQLDINSGDYLFTAGDVFARRFSIQEGGSITWDGDPIDALLNIPATFRTRASSSGLPENFGTNSQIPVNVLLDVSGRVRTPIVDLSLEVDRSNREILGNYQAIETFLNHPERSTEYATSVLLTNTFLLTTSDVSGESALSSSGSITFNSVSQLVSSQINRILSEALPNVDINFGVSQGNNIQALDVTGDVAFYLLNERLVIRGQGVVFQNDPTNNQQALEGEVMVEMRLNPSVAVEVFLRREGDVFADALTNTRGAGLSYQTQFSSWRALMKRLFGWVARDKKGSDESPPTSEPVTTPES